MGSGFLFVPLTHLHTYIVFVDVFTRYVSTLVIPNPIPVLDPILVVSFTLWLPIIGILNPLTIRFLSPS